MKNINLAILLVLFILLIYFIYKNQENFKLKNTNKNTEKKSENPSSLILGVYYTDWCGYSRDFLKQLEGGLKKKLENEGITIRLVDCDKNKDACNKYKIEGFPTLLLHTDKNVIHYNGNRTDVDLLDFIKSNKNSENKNTNKILGVYYTEWCGYSHDFLKQLDSNLKTKLEKEGVSISLVDCDKNKETCNKYKIEGFPTLLLHIDKNVIHYNGNRTDEDLLNFVKSNN